MRAQGIEIRLLDFEHVLEIADSFFNQGMRHLCIGKRARGREQNRAARNAHAQFIGSHLHGVVHLAEPALPEFHALGLIASSKIRSALDEYAGAMPHQRRCVSRIASQLVFAKLHGAIEGLLVAGEPGEKVVAHPHIEAFLCGCQPQHCQTEAKHGNGGLENVIHVNLPSSSTVNDPAVHRP